MTDIPGGVTPEVGTVANDLHRFSTPSPYFTNEIRIAEDQMQRLLECIHGVNLKPKTKPDVYGPGEHKPGIKQSEYPTYDPEGYRKTLEAQIECLQSNLDAANDRAHKADREVERLKQCVEDSDNNATYWREQAELCTIEEIQKIKKEIKQLQAHNETLEALLHEATSKLAIAESNTPKERLKASIKYNSCHGCGVYVNCPTEIESIRVSPWFSGHGEARQWAEDHGLEVVE